MLAPTGTIAFMMDCDTTGIEPDIALIKYKKLVGEGFLKIVNQTVPGALRKLGYTPGPGRGDRRLRQRARDDRGRARPQAGAPAGLRLRLQAGQRRAVHPLHGPRPDDGRGPAVPLGRHQQDRQHARGGHGRGDRGRSTSRAGSWASRPSPSTATAASAASRSRTGKKKDARRGRAGRRSAALRKQLAAAQAEATSRTGAACPAERTAVTHKFEIAGHEGYITVGLYPDGQPGEIFLKMAKEGSHGQRPDGHLRHARQRRAPVRRAAARPGQQVRPRPVRAVRLHGQPARSRSPSRSSTTSSAGSGPRFLPIDERQSLGLIDPRGARGAGVSGASRPGGDLSVGARGIASVRARRPPPTATRRRGATRRRHRAPRPGATC